MGQLAEDALGSLVEFHTPKQIQLEYPDGERELVDGGHHNMIAGQPTDDSEMALLLARMLVDKGRYDSEEARKAYVFWFDSKPFCCGTTTAYALQGGRHNPDIPANGAMMRVSPLDIFGARHDSELAEWARQDSRITHINPVCQQANALFTMAIAHAVRDGCDAGNLYEQIVTWAVNMDVEESLLNAVQGASTKPPADYVHQQGWLMIAFRNALWQPPHAPNLEEGIC